MKTPRKCGRCRAYEPCGVGVNGGGGIEYRCTLGYKQKCGVPEEPCLKPLTISGFVGLMKKLNRS